MLNPKIMKYKPNRMSFWFCMLAIVLNAIAFVWIYKDNTLVPTYKMGIDILINIIFMMTVFLAAEKLKTYDKAFCFVAFVLFVAQPLRLLYIPAYYRATDPQLLSDSAYTLQVLMLVFSGICMLAAGGVGLLKNIVLTSYLKQEKIEEKG